MRTLNSNGEPPSRGSSIPRGLKTGIGVVGFGLALLVGVWLILFALASMRLSEAIASARSAGYATSLAEAAPPLLPADLNAAPHFLAAFSMHPDPRGKDPVLSRAEQAGYAALGPEEKDGVRIHLEKSAELFMKIRAGRKIGQCRYDRDYSKPELPEGLIVLPTVRLLVLKGEFEIASGRNAEVRDTVSDILALAESFRRDPLLVAQLIRLMILTQGIELVHRALTPPTDETELRLWEEIVPKPETLDGAIQRGLQGDLAWGAEFVGKPIGEVVTVLDNGQEPPWLMKTSLLAPYWRILGSNYLKQMIRLIEISRKPYPESRPQLEALTEEVRTKSQMWDLLSALLLPALIKPVQIQAQMQSTLAVLRTGLAWELEWITQGRYPQTVEMKDPLSGLPLRLDREGGTISSPGPPGYHASPDEIDLLSWKLRHGTSK